MKRRERGICALYINYIILTFFCLEAKETKVQGFL